jgi:DNA-binding Xre family transcriptional regulator
MQSIHYGRSAIVEKVLYHISYNRLWKLLIDKHMMKKDLQKITSLSSNVITKMGKGESVTLETLAKICIALQCGISDIVEIKWEKQ